MELNKLIQEQKKYKYLLIAKIFERHSYAKEYSDDLWWSVFDTYDLLTETELQIRLSEIEHAQNIFELYKETGMIIYNT
jgi:hypothetical protein